MSDAATTAPVEKKYKYQELLKTGLESVRKVAAEEFSLSGYFNSDTPIQTIASMILRVQSGEPPVSAEQEAEIQKKMNALGGSEFKLGPTEEERFWVTVHQDGTSASQNVVVTVNGVACRIKRGVRVPLQKQYIHALENAVETRYEDDGKGNYDPRDVPRFAFTVHGPVEVN